MTQVLRFADALRSTLPVTGYAAHYRLDTISSALSKLAKLDIWQAEANNVAPQTMLLQNPSHTVQTRSVATRALQPVARNALPVTSPRTHSNTTVNLQQHAGSPISSSSSSSVSSSSWAARFTVAASAAAEAAEAAHAERPAAESEWSVLNFYHLVDIADPDEVGCSCVNN